MTREIQLDLESADLNDANAPGKSHTDSRVYLYFDQNSDEECSWTTKLPDDYSSGLQFHYIAYAAIGSDDVKCAVEIMKATPNISQDISVTSYDTANTSVKAVPGSVGHAFSDTISCTNDDSASAGDYIAVRFSRLGSDGDDDANGLLVVYFCWLTYVAA